MKNFEVILAFENYRVGQVIQPTGLWRDNLLGRGYIKAVEEVSPANETRQEPKVKRKKREEKTGEELSVSGVL